MDSGERIAGLQHEIVAKARQIGTIRRLMAGASAAILAIPALLMAFSEFRHPSELGPIWIALGVTCLALPAVAAGVCVGLAGAAGVRNACARSLELRLSQLKPSEQQAVVLGLQRDLSRDTRGLLEPLLEQMRCRSEVSPAAAPEGRGNEAAAGSEGNESA
jgi:hypothetical protein